MQEDILNKQIKNWEDQLLDLGKRNRMISFRSTRRSTLNILTPTMEELYRQVIVQERELRFQRPITRDSEPRMFAALQLMDVLGSPMQVCVGDIRCEGDLAENARTLRNLRSRAKLAMDEQGSNILYLIFGFIEWKEKGSRQDTWLRSPLLLAPVSLNLPSINGAYSLKRRDDEVVVNPTASYLFSRDYGLELPEFDSDRDDLEEYFRKVEDLADEKGWRVLRQSSLGLVSFQKISMYNDLVRNEDSIQGNPIIRALAGEKNHVSQPQLQEDTFDHDAIPSGQYHQVLSADSSQQDAIALSRKGVSFVLQGPPGTGKSQTIANIIAQGIADGKKILFVSEKMAALDVVHKRLSDANLAEFCLPVHSHKANKRDILRQLEASLDLKHLRVGDETLMCYPRLDMVTRELKDYVTQLHEPRGAMNVSIYDACGALAKRQHLPDLSLVFPGLENISREHLDKLSLLVQKLDRNRSALKGNWRKHPWDGFMGTYPQPGQRLELGKLLNDLASELEELVLIRLENCCFGDVLNLGQLETAAALFEDVCGCQMLAEHWLCSDTELPEKLLSRRAELLNKLEHVNDRLRAMSPRGIPETGTKMPGIGMNQALEVIRGDNDAPIEEIFRNLERYSVQLESILRSRRNLASFKESFVCTHQIEDSTMAPEQLARLCVLARDVGALDEHYFHEEQFRRMEELHEKLSEASTAYHSSRQGILEEYTPEIVNLSDPRTCLAQLTRNAEHFRWLLPADREEILQIRKIAEGVQGELEKIKSLKDAQCWQRIALSHGFAAPATFREAIGHRKLLREMDGISAPDAWCTLQGREKAARLLSLAQDKSREWEKAFSLMRENAGALGISVPGGAYVGDYLPQLNNLYNQPEDAGILARALDEPDVWENLNALENTISVLKKDYSQLLDLLLSGSVISLSPEQMRWEYWAAHAGAAASNPRQCWANNRQKAYDILQEAEKMAELLKQEYRNILASCESDVFNLDYMGILNRFKTDYTGFLRHLMPQYRRDVNQIRLAFRDVRRKISDEEIIKLLMELRVYHEHLEQYNAMRPRLRNWFDVGQYDMFQDWTAVRRRLDDFYHFSMLFSREEAAVQFINAGHWKTAEQILMECGKLAARLTENTRAGQLFGLRYCAQRTDVETLRRDLETVRESRALFGTREDYIAFCQCGAQSPTYAQLMENANVALSCEKWFRQNQDELSRNAGDKVCFNAHYFRKTALKLELVSKAAAIFGEENMLQWIRQRGEFHKSYGALLEEVALLEKLLANISGAAEDSIEEKTTYALVNDLAAAVSSAREWLRISKTVTGYLKSPETSYRLTASQIHETLARVEIVRKSQETHSALAREAEALFGKDYAGLETDWERIGRKMLLRKNLDGLMPGGIPENLRRVITRGGALWPSGAVEELQRELDVIDRNHALLGGFRENRTVQESADREKQIGNAIRVVQNLVQAVEGCMRTKPEYAQLCSIFAAMDEAEALRSELAETEKSLRAALPELPETVTWEQAEAMFAQLKGLKSLLFSGKLDHRLVDWLLAKNSRTNPEIIHSHIQRLLTRREAIAMVYDNFAGAQSRMEMSLSAMSRHLRGCVTFFDDLEGWIDLRNISEECAGAGLGQFVRESGQSAYPDGNLMDCFLKAVYRDWIDAVSAEVHSIAQLRSHSHDRTVEDFCRLDDRQLPVDQMRIREKLTQNMPSRSDYPRAADEMSVLLHELGKKRNIMALRKLFRAIPNLLLRLKPCLMMSPMSVAHFLEAKTYRFDMVIFDEASQIFPQDAVGAIFRGNQVIIAGDSNQLPPTNFFTASTNDSWAAEDEEEEQVCFDSILEAAAGTLLNRSLLWHYRSRYEELITFSNREIYGNHLITFPSSTIGLPDTGVEYVYVENGVYANRSNRMEALRIVQLVQEHISRDEGRSLGVIAFSEAQQTMIEDEIHKFRLENPQYEKFFDENDEEPFFVKNLENVQGDERDTIIFSICYGKNAQGRMYMRFGPLGIEGGERRLNVAITRAKRNIKLVGSILPEEIDLRRTQAEGVRLLRSYIAFAIRDKRPEALGLEKPDDHSEAFVSQVARFLENNGFRTVQHLGNSEYTVDIAVEHPGKPGCYLAGVECDGYVYRKARTVRDRDHLRPGVMKNMGWKLYRIWSVAWMRNPQAEQQRLLEFLQEALFNGTNERTPAPQNLKEPEIQLCEAEKNPMSDPVDPENPYGLPMYTQSDWQRVDIRDCTAPDQILERRIMAVLQAEQPVHLELLCRRLAESFGVSKATQTVRESILEVLNGSLSDKVVMEDQFVRFFAAKCAVRRSPLGQPHRAIEHICVGEIADAMELILRGSFGIERNVLCLETARIFGYERMGSKIRQRTNLALEELLTRGRISLTEDKVQLAEV